MEMQLKLWSSGLALALASACVPAAASLGEDASSVAADGAQLHAKIDVASGYRFDVHRLQLPSGISVQEYVSPAGMVFAVSWHGPDIPDLQQILGRYFDTYVNALNNRDGVSGPGTVALPGLVVQSTGHMRAFSGRAYVPLMLPQGVAEKEIQ
jgi:Protein of unknown function (DUF2844)